MKYLNDTNLISFQLFFNKHCTESQRKLSLPLLYKVTNINFLKNKTPTAFDLTLSSG